VWPKHKFINPQTAELVGKNLQNLTTSEKKPYEQQAFDAKEKYTSELGAAGKV
jgi:hypothetical protein